MAEAKLTAENLPKLIEALGLPPDAPLTDVMASLRALVMAEAGEPQPTAETPAEEELADAPPAEGEEEEEPEDGAATMAAAGRLFAMTGKGTFGEAIDEVDVWRKSHQQLAKREKDLADRQATMEASDRLTLTRELIGFGGELPSIAWKDPTLPPAKLTLSDRLKKEPMESLRERHAAWKAKAGKTPPGSKPPVGGEGGDPELNEREQRMLAGKKPEEIAAYKARKAKFTKKGG